VKEVNTYLEEETGRKPCVLAIQKAALYVTTILKVLGVAKGQHKIGFGLEGAAGGDKEATLAPYLDTLNTFRSAVREAARDRKNPNMVRISCVVEPQLLFADIPSASNTGGEHSCRMRCRTRRCVATGSIWLSVVVVLSIAG